MTLSAAAHHSFDKVAAGEKYDGHGHRRRDRAGAANKAPRRPRSNAAGDAVFFELFDEDTAGVRPGVLAEPPPQERVPRHVVEHLVRVAPVVQILDAPVPQTVEQLPDILRFFDTLMPVPEQVIEVPKILPEDVSMRIAVSDTQLTEQLVEVPTIISFSSLQRIREQNFDIPVPTGQSSTATHSSEERISERIVEQIVGIPISVSLRRDFPASVSDADEPGEVFFRTFPQHKKSAAFAPSPSPRVHASVSSSTPAPQRRIRLNAWVMILTDQGPYYWDCRTGETR